MTLKPEMKGYAWILLATVTGSTVYVFSKAALNEVSLFQFGFWWFSMAIGWNLLYTLGSGESRKKQTLPFSTFKVLLLLGLVETLATGTFYTAIQVSANPSIPSFLRNMEYIFITLLGVILLKERFRGLEIAGVALTITGAFVISYHRGGTLSSYLTGSSGLMLLCTSIYAIRTILAKKFIHRITPATMAINRAVWLFLLAAILLVSFGESIRIPNSAMLNIAVGSFLGPLLTSIGQYSALKYIEASRAAIIQSSTALFTVLGVFLYFGKLPMGYQFVGGLITIGGVMMLLKGKKNKGERRKKDVRF
ncbi:MAG: hypothetical protein A2X22_09810 [Bacteroidetes bacterium GWF2_49_14]|nr:MAG: hypothetical protein A2X22_09810 [Bacteroidetes bacterium GWF2_49_14]